MDIDVYQTCPCNSGKKIKFCCAKDIVSELNQILGKSAAGQATAAIDLIEIVEEKVGQRDCLSIIKTHILLSGEDIEEAQRVNEEFLAIKPKHPVGLQHRALISVGMRDMEQAVYNLQKAMDAIPGNEIPVSFANAFRTVGMGLLTVGHLLAARAHFNFALMLKESDEQAQGLLIETYRMQDVSLLLKHDVRLEQPPETDTPWRKHYVNAIKALDRGQFLFGLKILKKADEETPDVREIKRGIAILTTNLAMESEIGGAWREYASLPELDRWEAVEAEAFAQLLGPEEICERTDLVALTIELSELLRASEAAMASPRFVSTPVPPVEPEQGPPPRFCFVVLDKDEIKDVEGVELDAIPNVCGEIYMFGKQTDREARLECVLNRDEDFDANVAMLKETFSGEIQGEIEEEVIGDVSLLQEKMTWNWHLPKGITREQYGELNEAMRKKVFMEVWPEVPLKLFDNQTAREAAKDDSNHVALEALMLQLEQSSSQVAEDDGLAGELRKSLGLPEPEMVDPTTLGDRLVSPVRQKYLMYDKLSDEQLVALQSEAMTIGNMHVLRQVIPEILNRESTNELIPHDLCHSVLAQISNDDETCFEHLKSARRIAVANNRPIGVYLVQELEASMMRGRTESIPELLREIETKHMGEPNVEYQLVRVLQKFGLIGPDGRMAAPQPAAVGAGVAEEAGGAGGAIWSPDNPNPGGSGGSDEPPSGPKLIIPG